MAYLDPKTYFPSIQDLAYRGCDIYWDGYTVMKNCGNFIQLMFPSSAKKGHDTYELYLDSAGKLVKVIGHSGNAGFTGTKTYEK